MARQRRSQSHALATNPAPVQQTVRAEDIATICGVGRAKAYAILRRLGVKNGGRIILSRARLDEYLASDPVDAERLEIEAIARKLGVPVQVVRACIAQKRARERAAR